jgi:hypothetical protein
MFENRVLERIFEPKGDESVGCCRKIHVQLRDFYSLPSRQGDQIKEDGWDM